MITTSNDAFMRLMNQCDIYLDNSLISKEQIIQRYMEFFSSMFNEPSHSLSVAQHTGSVCFDGVSLLFAAVGALALNVTDNNDVIRSLENEDMVLYKKQRHLWRGFAKHIQKSDLSPSAYVASGFENAEFAVLEQPSHLSTRDYVPRNLWNRIAPYKGASTRTDGRGIRRTRSNRNDFISYLFDIPTVSIPSVIGVSAVIVTDRESFRHIADGVRVEYGDGKSIGLLDLVTASYYTSHLEEHQYGPNPAKTEPILKVTSRISAARDLVLDKSGNKTVGFMVVGTKSVTSGSSELSELLDRQSLKFSILTASVNSTIAQEIIEAKKDASIFVCTKEFLLQHSGLPKAENPLISELDCQIENILNNDVSIVPVEGGCSWQELRAMKNALLAIRQSDIRSEEKDDFIITAHTLTNLALTAVFPLNRLNHALERGAFNSRATPPSIKLHTLWESAGSPTELTDQFLVVADTVDRLYHSVLSTCPKYDFLIDLINQYAGQRIALVVPKLYYVDLLKMDNAIRAQCATIVTANRFNQSEQYDLIIVTGDFAGTQFNPLKCRSASNISVLLYDGEIQYFRYKKRQADAYEKAINVRLGIGGPHETNDDESIETGAADDVLSIVVGDSDLERYIEKVTLLDVYSFAKKVSDDSNNTAHSTDVYAVGRFINGKQIMFTRYYHAVVFDEIQKTVVEKEVDSLRAGDIIIFAKRDDYTKNMVDYVYDQLQRTGRFSDSLLDATSKAHYWKVALREYKETNDLSYREVAKQLNAYGLSIQEVSVRQWLIQESHIIGPREENTLTQIANLTRDTFLLENPHTYFEACEIVRKQRKKILKLIGKAIGDKLSGLAPTEDELLGTIFDNVDNLSEILELDDVSVLDKPVSLPTTFANRPIKPMEAML